MVLGVEHVDQHHQVLTELEGQADHVPALLSLPKRSDFLGLWSAIGLFGANWSEKGPILRSKVRF